MAPSSRLFVPFAVICLALTAAAAFAQRNAVPDPIELNSNWQLQDSAKVSDPGATVSSASYQPAGWLAATVPGTVLTSLVNDKVYPEPTYGENNRETIIPESLNKTSYWYRTTIAIPKNYAHHQVWLHFDGANFTSEVWVNGTHAGTINGAFIRGRFDITPLVRPGSTAVLAVKVSPQPHPGDPHEHTIANGVGKNGGITAIDGPTFLCTIGWDWLNAVRDRDTGLWQKVWLSASGPVLINDPQVITDLPLPKTDSADITVNATLQNTSPKPQTGTLEGTIGDITFSQKVTLKPNETQTVTFDPKTYAPLHLANPKLWWPNGYGPQNLYTLHLHFVEHGHDSDAHSTTFGIRKITYEAPGMDALTISVNGVKVFIRGGDWGLDEALKRIPRARLDAEIHMHALANMNLIRNWVGQSTGDDFYELCDKYGILIWDEFFQPNPSDGPNPDDFAIYMANVRDKILRYRNHPSIALWCARNEGYPPPEIDAALRKLIPELDPARLYQPSSTAGRGVMSSGPYYWREPRAFYVFDAPFKTETGSMSVPTLESIHGMMPEKDWNTINDDWAAHDFAKGAQHGDTYPYVLAGRYGRIANLADFVRKAQMMNYEAYRAMYEGRNKLLFKPATGVITWMSNPAQPSFVWQLYHYDLEPNASLFAVKSASELVHIQMDEDDFHLRVINNLPTDLSGDIAHIAIYTLWGKGQPALEKDIPVSGPADTAIDLGPIPLPEHLSSLYFAELELRDAQGQILSRNLYWEPNPSQGDDLTPLNQLPTVKLEATVARHDSGSDSAARLGLTVTLKNPGPSIALMAHLQLRRKSTSDRVLPVFYSDNYISLAPGETRTVTIDAALADLKGDTPLVVVDGWNIDVTPVSNADSALALNTDAQVSHWPATGLPMITAGLEPTER
ncbi:MAG TPA: glycoside hydrolase family 2 TIM barrel-domain containing protein [Acidobacteriaceae bacterium]|nr:glycoside hydrolase family 2 TIM barrel-domain containing protein [Acidobacteriaceae bacterium]